MILISYFSFLLLTSANPLPPNQSLHSSVVSFEQQTSPYNQTVMSYNDFPTESDLKNMIDPNSKTVMWLPCPHTSQTSFVNFTFSPYPILRKHLLNYTLQGEIHDDIPLGTVLEMQSHHTVFTFIPGPSFTIKICDLIKNSFTNDPVPIQCPISQWAIQLALLDIQQKDNSALSSSYTVPGWVLPGEYYATVQLKTTDQILTCAQTLLTIE